MTSRNYSEKIRKSISIYKRIRHIKGHGVHSPFVYHLITQVIDERCSYYRIDDIEFIRKQLLFKEDVIPVPGKPSEKGNLVRTVGDITRREAISPKHGALLFRLTNYFKPKNILQVGGKTGLSTLFLTSYSSATKCLSLKNIPEYAPISDWVYVKAAQAPIDSRIGGFAETLPPALKDMHQLDFAFFNLYDKQTDYFGLFTNCLRHAHAETVFVFEGINANHRMKAFWKQVYTHPETTVAIDLYSMGLVFLNKKLHKRMYTIYF